LTGPDPDPRHPPADPAGDRRRIDDLDARLKKLRGTVEKPKQASGAGGVSHRQTGVAYRVLVDMIAGLLVGGFLGYGSIVIGLDAVRFDAWPDRGVCGWRQQCGSHPGVLEDMAKDEFP
jgi:hypothetical protein